MTKGDEIMSGLTEFAEKYHIKNAHFTGLGAINKGLFGWADRESGRGQKKIELNQEAEIVSFIGNISMDSEGRSIVHGHGSVALSDGSVKGGHWWEVYVSIIAVVFVTEAEGAPEANKESKEVAGKGWIRERQLFHDFRRGRRGRHVANTGRSLLHLNDD